MQTLNNLKILYFLCFLTSSCSVKNNNKVDTTTEKISQTKVNSVQSQYSEFDTLRTKEVNVLKVTNNILEKEILNFLKQLLIKKMMVNEQRNIVIYFKAHSQKKDSYYMQISYSRPYSFNSLLGIFQLNNFNFHVYSDIENICFFNFSSKNKKQYEILKKRFPKPEEYPSVDMEFNLNKCEIVNLKRTYNNF